MIGSITQMYIRELKPKLFGWLTRFIYSSSNIEFGKKLICDGVPRILIDTNAKLIIGDNVQLRKDVEIRVHGTSLIQLGANVRIDRGVRLLSANDSTVSIGNKTAIGFYSILNGGDDISLGEACLISGFVYLQTSMHEYAKGSFIKEQGYSHSPVKLGNDVWLGAHVVVLPGCELSDGVIVGSNSVVTSSIESEHIAVGVPAKTIRLRE